MTDAKISGQDKEDREAQAVNIKEKAVKKSPLFVNYSCHYTCILRFSETEIPRSSIMRGYLSGISQYRSR